MPQKLLLYKTYKDYKKNLGLKLILFQSTSKEALVFDMGTLSSLTPYLNKSRLNCGLHKVQNVGQSDPHHGFFFSITKKKGFNYVPKVIPTNVLSFNGS